ncbi:FAD-binding domain-containing protein [Lichenihabitans sp. Uapishka_5]|uniref:FAD-binding domain-containing protein n=1 Tax=Lichenihabitans sp. Uapishka_5 TaxID=3037302 RepID=UPI0029E7E505|nr:FAD-binding domain-containing protein [Lichenihabitans sp. Uapishka_5]MDX7952545.1 FAD-binding domain-containing protein [Lichenihabitans sp. Uapishka_5]
MTRAEGLTRLAAFIEGPGASYANMRNTDRGGGAPPTTSALSPYLRRRLISEQEVVEAAVGAFGEREAEKFVSEVFWRTYFKGHLETHPQAWTNYLDGVEEGRRHLDAEPGLRRIHQRAVEGGTGIDGFDDWSRDLVETGWLHNHARMWFASIWIFTLRLPWELGADFFMRHLVDGDPASNTLSWRWVAGLHTRGKHYVARRDNVRRCTEGRHDPRGLDEDPASLEEAIPPREVTVPVADAAPSGDVALLMHLDDLHPESLLSERMRVVRIAGLVAHAAGASPLVREADRQAMADGLERSRLHFGCEVRPVAKGWAGDLPVVTAWAPVGPSAAILPAGCIRIRRAWDEAAWPSCNRGYSRLRAAIPRLTSASRSPIA